MLNMSASVIHKIVLLI